MRRFVLSGLIFLFTAAIPSEPSIPPGRLPAISIRPAIQGVLGLPVYFPTQAAPVGHFFPSARFTAILSGVVPYLFIVFPGPLSVCTESRLVAEETASRDMPDEMGIADYDGSLWTDEPGGQAGVIYDDDFDLSLAIHPTRASYKDKVPTDQIHRSWSTEIARRPTDGILYCANFIVEIGIPTVAGLAPPVWISNDLPGSSPENRTLVYRGEPPWRRPPDVTFECQTTFIYHFGTHGLFLLKRDIDNENVVPVKIA